jgi:hypothetical protein
VQDALSFGEIKSGVREVEGQKYYEVEVDSPDVQYLASITVKDGKVFGMFVKTPTRVRGGRAGSTQPGMRHLARRSATQGRAVPPGQACSSWTTAAGRAARPLGHGAR